MKYKLEKYREIILIAYDLLIWQQKYFPGVIAALVSLAFLLFWYMNLTLVTSIALFGLGVTLFDYSYPKIARMVFKSDNWNALHETKFEQFVEKLFQIKEKTKQLANFICQSKQEKSTLFILASSTVCILLAWIGSTINNLFLAYLTSLVILLYPGLSHQGHLKFFADFIDSRINFHFNSAGGGTAGQSSGSGKKEN